MTLPQAPRADEKATDQPPTDEITYNGKSYSKIREGLADILNPRSTQADKNGNVKQSVFYNPIQQFNRDLSVLAIRAFAEDLAIIRRARHERRLQNLARGPKKGKKRKREETGSTETSNGNASKKGEVVETSPHVNGQDDASHVIQAVREAELVSEAPNQNSGPMVNDVSSGKAGATTDDILPPNRQKDEIRSTQENSSLPQSHPELDQSKVKPKGGNGVATDPNRIFRILDALSATGLRALRYAKEISYVTSVVANDLSPSATDSIKLNVAYNGLEAKVTPITGDAKALMYQVGTHAHSNHNIPIKEQFHVVDLDPYGTAAPFIDAAVQAVADGGLLCVTCTDAGIYASVGWPEKTYSQYGGSPWRGPQGHEAGLRLILNSVATSAARYGLAVEPLLSLNIDFYVRLFIRVKRSPVEVKCLASKTMVVYNCDHGCGSSSIQYLGHTREREAKNGDKFRDHTLVQGPTATPSCEHCGFKTHLAGPMWGGPLHNPHFISRILDLIPSLDSPVYGTIPRIEGMLNLALNETLFQDLPKMASPESTAAEPFPSLDPALRDPHPFFINPSTLSRTLHCSRPSDAAFRGALIGLGYRTTRSHTEAGSIRTDAPWHVIWEIMREWVRQKHPIKEGAITKGMAGWEILRKDRSRRKLNDAKQELREIVEGAESVDSLRESMEAALYRISKKTPETANGSKENGTMEQGDGNEEANELKVVFDEKLGKEVVGKKMVRYQQNPRPEWGPMTRAKGGQ
ncbi:MAG: hypothetical protein Q9170_006417 [Blastenia crenularia]